MAKINSTRTNDAALPPAGFVDRHEAARMFGMSADTWHAWERKAAITCGRIVPMPAPGTRMKLYPLDELRQLAEEYRRAQVFPPAGFVERETATRLYGVSEESIRYWAKQGRLCGVRLVKKPGSRARVTVYPEAEVRRLVEEVRAGKEAPFPPPGYVDRYQAAAMFEMHASQFVVWQRLGRIRCASKTVKGPEGGPAKIYAVADVEHARAELEAQDAAAQKPPEGFVSIEGAAKFFDAHVGTITNWQREGLLRGTWHDLPGKRGRRRVYAIAELERARDQMAAEAARPTAPEGFIELHKAAQALGVVIGTFLKWEKDREVARGQVVPIPGTSARTKIYPIAEIERLREEIRQASENFPPQGWVEMEEAARRANVSVAVWKKWLGEGRVENWRWARRPTMARCKLFAAEEVERIVAELGRDHQFFMEEDGQGGWRPPEGYVGRAGAAAMFGVAEGTFVHWQTDGRITCGRWARIPVGAGMGEGGGRRVYPVEELSRLAEEFAKVGKPYVDPEDASIARVPIMSWSKTRFEAIIDAADLPLIEGIRWNWMPRYDEDGGEEEAVVVRSAPSGEQVPLRRILLGLQGRQYHISQRNGDGLDCRRANLVVRTPTESLGHARKRKTTHGGRPPTSRFKGVCWIKGKWRAQIQKEGQRHKLGWFEDEIAAAQAYDEAAGELFGEHARLNFPDGIDAWLEREGQETQMRDAA